MCMTFEATSTASHKSSTFMIRDTRGVHRYVRVACARECVFRMH
jgi:hypothetical protein